MSVGMQKKNINMAMRRQVIPQNISLLWQLINHKHIVSIPELLGIIVNFN